MDVATHWGPLDGLDANELAEWSALGHEAPWANPFAMPEFVLPAARWLTPQGPPSVLRIVRGTGRDARLVGVGCFVDQPANLFVPLRHLRSYLTLHTFRTGLLARAGEEAVVADALARFAGSGSRRRHVLAFDKLAPGDPLAQALDRRVGVDAGRCHERHRYERPVLWLQPGIDDPVPAAMRKDLARRLRRLGEQGAVEYRILRGDEADAEAVDTHLRLEHQGWKREAGTSMLANEHEAAFFRDLSARFGETGAMVFTEIRLDGVPIASTSNILLGDTLHAFKSGWEPAFARYSPGRLNEWMLLQALRATWPGLRCFDSMASGDSHMAAMLPDREAVATGVYSLSRLGNLAMQAARAWRPLAYRLSADD